MRRPWAKQAPSLGKAPADLSCLPLRLAPSPTMLTNPCPLVLFLLLVPVLTPLLHIICLTHHRYHGPEAAGRPSSSHPAHRLHSAPSRGIACVFPALPLNSQLLEGSSHGWLISGPGLGYTFGESTF